jgi:glycine/D-amino acid oxidase-like deaminating enzyme
MTQIETFEVDTLIIGAGLIGSSVAMHLARLGAGGIRVIDFDLEGTLSSSELNAGGVRATWNQPLNIQASKISIEYFASVAEDVGYRPCGYLWLHAPEKLPAALQARETQTRMGWPVEAWDVAELRRRVPFIDKTDGIAGAIFAPRDGLVNPNLLKNHYRARARAKGVTFDDHTLVRLATAQPQGLTIECDRFEGEIIPEAKAGILARQEPTLPRHTVRYHAQRVVNCAGPWAPLIAQILGYPCPSHPVRRQVCIFDCRDVDLTPYGMIVDTSGVYFHPEATNGLAGFADPNEPVGVNYAYDGEKFFMETIWPALYERSSAFERLKHLTGWAGLYEVSPDESAIIGEVGQGGAAGSGRLYEAHSFSGHGAMHSYTAGLALAEKMVLGRYETFDASPLSAARFESGLLVTETLVI